MAEYIERDAARECIHKWLADIFGIDNPELTVLDKRINAIPAADVVPVVRCGECKHWFDNETDLCSCDRDALLRRRDFFCADGERKDGDGDGV